jgi:hypothetical protein
MRVFFGIILGILLTIGGAYIFDSATAGTDVSAAEAPATRLDRPMVNWDVVDRRWQQLEGRVRRGWAKLAAN